ncbi:hypothetical protein NONI108955_08910 [Nocardia ninae]|uniref:Uncharacterized protein n=1 Tax=Nocardia ninae NBRC 108245 TaxID=1210091 RepID=A0A511ML46_9NOCA|nr:hypothetical protein [Nocardia ninae]GEM40857.1 hypothetical protein NN4_53760 [Nocardia ninae NBRC 108245]
MNVDEYAEAQRQIDVQSAATVYLLTKQFQSTDMSMLDWELLLRLLYPTIERARRQSAELARRFYDSQRAEHLPGAPRHDVQLPGYSPDWFREDMEPERRKMSQEDAASSAVDAVTLRTLKVVEGAGRRTIIDAVETDPGAANADPEPDRPEDPPREIEPKGSSAPAPGVTPRPSERSRKQVVGWARVTTSAEPCGFCQMMVSRGPTYGSASNAGFHGTDEMAIRLFGEGRDKQMRLMMRKWHTGCRCKVVPVFDRKNWPGRADYLAARRLWNDTTDGKSGRDAVNAFRRAVEAGYQRLKKDGSEQLPDAA